MPDVTTYTGGCHCGAVRYEVTSDFTQVITCNCSLCSKMGWMLSFVPGASFKLLSGEDNLTDYQFNKKIIHHYFCKTCGVRSFGKGVGADGQESYAINMNCLDDIDLTTMTPFAYDGKSM